ncbi:MAG: MMPL family transporter [Phycisphaerae bacterium]|mgnify:CR=1 FL=1|nr:MMPL family transporter [Phycisphaerae bacterium]
MESSTLLRSYAAFVVKRRWLVLTSLLAITMALGVGVARIYVEVDPDRQLPQDHPYIQALNETHRLFGDKNLVMIGLQPRDSDPFSPTFLAKVKEITDRIADIPGIVMPLLHGIASPTVKDITLAEDGLRVRPLMPESPATLAAAQALRARVFDDPSNMGTLVSFDGSALAIYATFELTRELPGYVNLHRAIEDVLRASDDRSLTYSLSGIVVITSSLSAYASQVAYFFPIALLVIGLVHYDAFRTWQAVVLPLLTGMLAVIWALGLMGHLAVPLDPFNSTTPVLILAVGAGHAVQILKRYYEEFGRLGDSSAAIIESIARVGPVMIAAGTIASLSFFSLATLGTDSMRTFGTFTGLGILSALVIEMTAIPALRAVLRPPRRQDWENENKVHPWLDRVLRYVGRKLGSLPAARAVILAYLAIIVVAVLLAGRIEVDTSLMRNFAPNDPVRVQDDTLNALFAGTNSLLFVLEGPEEGAIAEPAILRGIDAFERRLEELPGVGKAFSVVDTLKRLHRAMNPDAEFGELPSTKSLASQYLFLYTLSGGNDLASRLTPDNRTAKIVVMLHEDSTGYGEAIIASAKQIAAEELPANYRMHVAGTLASNAALTETMVKGKILNVLQIAAITIVVAAVIMRSVLGGLLVAIPLAIAVLINFGVMGALNIRLDIATAAVTAMAVGIGADYAVYFLFRTREEYGMDGNLEAALARSIATSGKAIIFVSSAVALGYAVLCFSGFRVFVQLGALVGLAMITSSLATLLAIPAMLTIISRTHLIHTVLGATGHLVDSTPKQTPRSAVGP